MNLKLLVCVSALSLFAAGSAFAGTGNANSGSYNGKDNTSLNLRADHNALDSNNTTNTAVAKDNNNAIDSNNNFTKNIVADNGNASDSFNKTTTTYDINAAVSLQSMSADVSGSGTSAHGLFAKADGRTGSANIGGGAQAYAAGVVMANANTGTASVAQQGSSIAAVGNLYFH